MKQQLSQTMWRIGPRFVGADEMARLADTLTRLTGHDYRRLTARINERSVCAQTDPEAFFPEKGGSTREAKGVCNGTPANHGHPEIPPCPARDDCLLAALFVPERFGIHGGISERERRGLLEALKPFRRAAKERIAAEKAEKANQPATVQAASAAAPAKAAA